MRFRAPSVRDSAMGRRYARPGGGSTRTFVWYGRRVAKKTDKKTTLNRDFEFRKDAELNEKIAAFVAEHRVATGQRLAMDARRSLGPTKVRITFRVVT